MFFYFFIIIFFTRFQVLSYLAVVNCILFHDKVDLAEKAWRLHTLKEGVKKVLLQFHYLTLQLCLLIKATSFLSEEQL